MHHEIHGTRALAGINPFWAIAALLALIALAGLIIWLIAERGRQGTGRESARGETEENLEGQIMAMLHQAGDSVLQTEIAANLDLSVDCVACALKDLEDRGPVTREWQGGEYTYSASNMQAGADRV